MDLNSKEDLINIIKGLTADVASLQETVTSLSTPETPEETKTPETPEESKTSETSEEDVDEIHKLLSGE